MSVESRAACNALCIPGLNSNLLGVLKELADWSNKFGHGAYSHRATIAYQLNIDPRTVTRLVKALEARGLVLVYEKKGGSAEYRNDKRPNLFELPFVLGWERDIPDLVPRSDPWNHHQRGDNRVTSPDLIAQGLGYKPDKNPFKERGDNNVTTSDLTRCQPTRHEVTAGASRGDKGVTQNRENIKNGVTSTGNCSGNDRESVSRGDQISLIVDWMFDPEHRSPRPLQSMRLVAAAVAKLLDAAHSPEAIKLASKTSMYWTVDSLEIELANVAKEAKRSPVAEFKPDPESPEPTEAEKAESREILARFKEERKSA